VKMNSSSDGSEFNRFSDFPSLVKRIAILAILIVLILAFLLGSELFARPNKELSEKVEYSTLYHSSDCATCHQVDAKGISAALKTAIPELCLQCHNEIAESMKAAYKHDIFAQGKCTLCHNIHPPSADHLLKTDSSSLCQGCHREAGELLVTSAHGRGVVAGFCLGCHANHSSNISGLLRSDPISLCVECHNLGSKERNHPVGGDIRDPLTGGKLTCTSSCHHPHGSTHEMMLRQENSDGLCLSCHEMNVT